MTVQVRNLRLGESLPNDLLDTGTPFLDPEWCWVVEPASLLGPFAPSQPFALVVASFAHGWLVLWRVLAISPIPDGIPLNWFLEAFPQVFAEARLRGCVGFLTFLADNRPAEVKLARIIQQLPGAALLPFQGSMAVGPTACVENLKGPR